VIINQFGTGGTAIVRAWLDCAFQCTSVNVGIPVTGAPAVIASFEFLMNGTVGMFSQANLISSLTSGWITGNIYLEAVYDEGNEGGVVGFLPQWMSCTFTNGSKVVTVASTALLATGMAMGSGANGMGLITAINSGTTFTCQNAASRNYTEICLIAPTAQLVCTLNSSNSYTHAYAPFSAGSGFLTYGPINPIFPSVGET
jgi:hypothetical protein